MQTAGIEPLKVESWKAASVIVPISAPVEGLAELHSAYSDRLRREGYEVQLVFVIDGEYEGAEAELADMARQHADVTLVRLARRFDDATATMAGVAQARFDRIVVLPPYHQIEPDSLVELLAELETADVAIPVREREGASSFARLQADVYSRLVSRIAGRKISDAGCDVRAFRRNVVREVAIYGDMHRFLPVLAHRQGFSIAEVPARMRSPERRQNVHAAGVYSRRVLDLLTAFFLVKFVKKPLRFFGLIGGSFALLGLIATAVLIFQRLVLGIDLGDRPALLLSSLMIVLGLQVIAIGLIGEIVIFSHAREIDDYTIKEVVNGGGSSAAQKQGAG